MSSFQSDIAGTRFLVAKYIPDMHRLEPRNIGVIVWSNGAVSAKFVGEHTTDDSVATRVPRRFGIQDRGVYQEWLRYWRSQMASPTLSLNGNGNRVSRDSSQFVDALRRCSKENFVLVDGGIVTGEVAPSEIGDVVHDLYSALVEERDESRDLQEEDSVLLKKAVSHVFRAAGIDRMEGYQTKLPLTFAVESRVFGFTFDWAVYTTRPRLVCQHALLTRPMTVNSAAFMFSCLTRADLASYRLSKDCCIALVRTTPALLDNSAARTEFEKLLAFGTIVDLADEERAIHQLRQLSLSV